MIPISKVMHDYSVFMTNVVDPDFKPEQSYPDDPMMIMISQLEKIDLDLEMEKDIINGNGFICSAARTIKKDLKDQNGIFSPKFGPTFGDQNQFIDRYRCQCLNPEDALRGRLNDGRICPKCGKPVKYVGDNFKYFAWMKLDNYTIIHPIIYMQLNYFFGSGDKGKSKLDNIINYQDEKDADGIVRAISDPPKNEPFYGIGLINFYSRFDEIMAYYLAMYPNKLEYFEQIMEDRKKVFTHSIPVYTTHLRPSQISNGRMSYEGTNGQYNMMNKLVTLINSNRLKISGEEGQKCQLLYNLQNEYMKLYNEITAILEGKKGIFRNLVAGRYNYTARSVITQDSSLDIDQVILSYYELVVVLEQKIVNILRRIYHITPAEAYDIWYRAQVKPDGRIIEIIESIINNSCEGRGIPVLVNRNPTLGYGSILQMFCIGMTLSFVMKLPIRSLTLMNADFDGDALNILHIINNAFFLKAYQLYNPRCAMQISRDTGKFNSQVCIQRDALINYNSFLLLGRNKYTPQMMDGINSIRKKRGW